MLVALLPYQPEVSAAAVRLSPSFVHPLGTDAVGRDVGLRLLAGVRPLVEGGGVALVIALALGVPAGAWAGARGGLVARLVCGAGVAVGSLPGIPLALLAGLLLGHGAVSLGVGWGVGCAPAVLQATYQRVDALRREERLLALVAHGIPEWRAVARHLVWNNSRIEIRMQSARVLAGFLAMETALSYLGRAGVAEPDPSWGNMLAMALASGAPAAAAAPAVVVALFSAGLWRLALPVRRAAAAGNLEPAAGALLVESLEVRSADRTLVRLPTFSVPQGTVTALVGASGSGKSLALRAIATVLPDGVCASGSVVRPRVAWVAQDGRASLDPLLRISDQGLPDDPVSLSAVLELSGFPAGLLSAWPHELSGGEAQRAALLCALSVPGAGLLLADEPTTGLDPRARRALVAALRRVTDAPARPAVLFVTHDRRLLPGFVDAVVELDAQPRSVIVRARPRVVAGEVLLTAEGLAVHAGLTRRPAHPSGPAILCGLSIEVRAGETVGLIGESGAGKTTLLRALAGLCGSSGALTVLGVDPRRAAPVGLQLIWQDPGTSLDPSMPVGELLAISARLGGTRRVEDALTRVGLSHRGDALPGELSGGERRRVSLAQVWLAGARLVMADEPTAALDAGRSVDALDLLRELVGDTGGVLLASHDLGLLLPLCDRVYVLHQGRCVDCFRPDEAGSAGRHPFTQSLLDAA